MTQSTKKFSKMELERSVLEMIKAARRLIIIKKDDPLWTGTYKETHKRLSKLEKQIYKQRKKSRSKAGLETIAKDLAHLVGHLCKSLIRYQYHFLRKCYHVAFL